MQHAKAAADPDNNTDLPTDTDVLTDTDVPTFSHAKRIVYAMQLLTMGLTMLPNTPNQQGIESSPQLGLRAAVDHRSSIADRPCKATSYRCIVGRETR